MVASLTPLKRIECSYDDCYHSFDSEAQMKAHLKNCENHPFYCGKTPKKEQLDRGFTKCDFHGKTWEDLLNHKVQDMMPWLVGDRKGESPRKFNHIVCEFCGLDFGSLGGREAHRKQMHTADQHIVCRGYMHVRDIEGRLIREECGMVFGRPSQLVHHIESGFCAYIRPKLLEDERQQKQVVKQILRDPAGFNVRNTSSNIQKEDTSTGGVDLLSQDDDYSQNSGPAPLSPTLTQASVSQTSTTEGVTLETAEHKPDEDWPTLPPSSSVFLNASTLLPLLSASMSALSVNSQHTTEPSAKGSDDMAFPPSHHAHDYDNSSLASDIATAGLDTDSITSPTISVGPWSKGKTSDRLFGYYPKKASQPNWDAINAAHQRTKLENDKSNLFYARFWDPYDPSYNPTLFFDDSIPGAPPYVCPFSECKCRFEESDEIGKHLLGSHAMQDKNCPLCFKRFTTLTRFIQHCESSSRGGKCSIAQHPGYARFLFEITGGLLSATKTAEEPIHGYKVETNTIKQKEPDAYQSTRTEIGVKDYDYEAMAPSRPALRKW